mgnify:CR=1 FL=1
MIKCFIINLERRKDRLQKISKHLKENNLNFVRFDAIDAENESEKTLNRNISQNGPLGKISKGDDGIRIFKFTNVGSKPLIINKVYSSCGCTIPKKPEKPILPGESGSIDVEYDTKRTGAFQKAITVNSNAVNSNIILRIKGEILPEPELDENGNPIENPKENKIVFKSTTFLFCSISFKLFPVM